MRFSACITTRNRPQGLDACLRSLWDSYVKPHLVVVSDDSSDSAIQQQNQVVVNNYPGTTYVLGPQTGVCANRNNAVNAIKAGETDLVAFIDDDICVTPEFIGAAVARYNAMTPAQQQSTILSGVSRNSDGYETGTSKLSFTGYFCPSETPETANIHASVFPHSFLLAEQWDENIFFGYEDAELCLRALKRDCQIIPCAEMRVLHTGDHNSTLSVDSINNLTKYEIQIEAARLYVGIKRYKNVFPNPFKLIAFISIYFAHMTLYLLKRGALSAFPEIVRASRIHRLWESASQLESA